MANKTSLRSSIRVGVSSSKSKQLVPLVSGGLISRSKSRDIGLCGSTSSDCGITSSANIAELIANTVGDDVGVQGFLLTLIDDWINGLECELGIVSAVKSSFELDGWSTGSEVESGDRGGDETIKGSSDSIVNRSGSSCSSGISSCTFGGRGNCGCYLTS